MTGSLPGTIDNSSGEDIFSFDLSTVGLTTTKIEIRTDSDPYVILAYYDQDIEIVDCNAKLEYIQGDNVDLDPITEFKFNEEINSLVIKELGFYSFETSACGSTARKYHGSVDCKPTLDWKYPACY